MASWGLGFEYGKKAYEEMRRTQEENDRYLAEHGLWETELRTKEAVAAATEASAKRTSAMSIALDKNTNAILSGDPQAYVNVLNAADPSVQFKHLGDGTIAQVDPKNPSMIIKGSAFSIKGKNPTSLVSELHKYAETTAGITEQHRASEQDEKDKKHEIKKVTLQNQGAKDVATIGANAKILAAEIEGAAKGLTGLSGSSGGSGGKSSRINLSDKDIEYLDSTVAQTLFGSGASGIRSEDGSWTVYQDGTPVKLSANDVKDLEDVHRAMIIGVSNLANTNSGSLRANIANIATTLGHQIRNNIDYEGARTAYIKERDAATKAREAGKEARNNLEVSGKIDYSNLSPEYQALIDEQHANWEEQVGRGAAAGMPVWDEKTWGAFSEDPRARTYGLVSLVQPSKKEPESKK